MKQLFVVLLMLLSCVVCDNSQSAEKDSIQNKNLIPSEIIKKINKEGVRNVVQELWEDKLKWDKLLENVASGENSWLKVAVKLRPGTDAGSSEMLDLSVGEALEKNPAAVLSIASKSFQDEKSFFMIFYVCDGPYIGDPRYDTFEKAKKAVERRILALNTVTDEKLIEKRNLCIKELNQAIPELQKYFKKKNYFGPPYPH